jgi:DNA-directed RNA polymerase specialized sigma24 family protein
MLTDYERERMAAAQECLRKLRKMNADIDSLLERRMLYEAKATKRTASYSDMPRGGRMESGVEYYACKLVELDREANERIDKYVDKRREIEARVDAMTDERYRKILRRRYVDWWDWGRIAAELGLPENTVRGCLHRSALLNYTTCCGDD